MKLDSDRTDRFAPGWPNGTSFLYLARHIDDFSSIDLHPGGTSSTDYIDWAVDALVDGFDTPHLRVLAGLDCEDTGSMWDAWAYFDRCIRELKLDIPSDAGSLLRAYLSDLVSQIAFGEADPSKALDRIHERVVSPLQHPQDLMGWCYLWASSDREREGSARRIVAYAKSWIRNGPDAVLMNLPEGLEVTYRPKPVKACRGGPNHPQYEYVYEMKVRPLDEPVQIEEFGIIDELEGRGVLASSTVEPFTADGFGGWYSCPTAILVPGQFFSMRNVVRGNGLLDCSILWYFVGATPRGAVAKGTVVVRLLADVEKQNQGSRFRIADRRGA